MASPSLLNAPVADRDRPEDQPGDQPAGGRYLGLEIGRGIAAGMVALSHAVGLVGESRWLGTPPFGGQPTNLNVGVDFFFVLSRRRRRARSGPRS